MLQDIRQSTKGTAAKVIVGLIVISFSLFGIESILVGGSGAGMAEVNGEEISPIEVQQAVNTQKRRLIAMLGDNLDPSMLDDQRLTAAALENLIGRKLLSQSAVDMQLTVSNPQVSAMIVAMEQFQLEGQFSPEMYSSALARAGYTPTSFKQGLKEDLVLNQLRSGLAGSEFVTATELALDAQIGGELRDVRYLTIPVANFAATEEISDQAVLAYYDGHQTDYRRQESVELDYIQLSREEFKQPVEEEALLSEYELEKEGYQYQTESRVSHILFEQAADESEDDLQQRVQAAQAELTAGKTFAETAKAHSDDIGSSGNGGDLGFTVGESFPAEMEEAIALLVLDQVSTAVNTDAGIHLIKLTAQRDGSMPELAELRADLEQRIQLRESAAELLKAVETLKDLAFNAADLDGPATELGLSVVRSEALTRSHDQGLFTNPSLLAAAFSDDVLEAGHNSDVIELSDSTFVVLRVRSHNPSAVKPLAEVRADIVATMTDDVARAAVSAEAEDALRLLAAGVGVEALAIEKGYQWQVELSAGRRNGMLPSQVLRRAFEMPQPGTVGSSFEYVITPAGDAQVFELARVTAGDFDGLSKAEQSALQQQAVGELGNLVNAEYQRSLRDRAEINIL